MLTIGLTAGHSHQADPELAWEHERCRAATEGLEELLAKAEFACVSVPPEVYELDNDAALFEKIRCFNERRVDVALELHLNAGGGDYSTCLYWDDEEGYFSEPGKQLAVEIAEQFKAAFPWRGIGAKGQTFFDRRLAFLGKTDMPAVITEVAFKDEPSHRTYMASKRGPVLYATSVFQGICRYVDGFQVDAGRGPG